MDEQRWSCEHIQWGNWNSTELRRFIVLKEWTPASWTLFMGQGNAITVEMLMLSLTYEKYSSNCQPSTCRERWHSIQLNVSLLSSLWRSVSIRYSRGFHSQQAVSFLTVGKSQVLQIIMIALFFRVSVSLWQWALQLTYRELNRGFFQLLTLFTSSYWHIAKTQMLQMYSDIHYKLTFSISDKEKKNQKHLSELIEIVLFAPWWLIQLPPKDTAFIQSHI